MTTKITKWIFGKTFFAAFAFFGLSIGAQAQTHPALGGGDGLSSRTAYRIETPAHLEQLEEYVNDGNGNTAGVYYIVINDLDLTNYAAGSGWYPIGRTGYSSFQGNFNGNGKVITNLKINQSTTDYQGLFGVISNASIQNLGIENCDIAGQLCVGGLVGQNYNSYISNCYATGNINGTDYVGGLVGLSNTYDGSSSTISNCYATGNVSGTNIVGGLVGLNTYSSTISNCYATGNVGGNNSVGGLVGLNNYSSTISNCYATGNVGGNNSVGGLVGINDYSSTISNCYATGNISGTDYIGGLVGLSDSSYPIKNCIAANYNVISTVNATSINRICGNTTGSFENNYALSTMVVKKISGNVTVTSYLNSNSGMSKTMTDFQNLSFYATANKWSGYAWDMNAVWDICVGKGLPWLRWQGINCNTTEIAATTATDGIVIYPNPVKDELRIENGDLRIEKVEICDLSGKTVCQFDNLKNKINVSDLPRGIYIVKLKTDKGVVTEKIMKE